jgi:hypothetical protein
MNQQPQEPWLAMFGEESGMVGDANDAATTGVVYPIGGAIIGGVIGFLVPTLIFGLPTSILGLKTGVIVGGTITGVIVGGLVGAFADPNAKLP